ncbi:MAG: choice-of-anchor Q domain-containing protein [Vicinamibacterales bacterium]
MRSACWLSIDKVVVCLLAILFSAATADAETRHVRKSGSDAGNFTCVLPTPCATVGHAVAIADPGDTIQIGKGKFVEIGEVFINKDLTLNGTGIFRTQVVASSWAPFRLFQIGVNADVRMTSMQIREGEADLGGGIRNNGALELEDVWIRRNTASQGGGIYNDGALVLTRVEIALNTSEGLFNAPAGTAIVTSSRLAANETLGLRNALGVVIMRDTLVVANGARLTRVGASTGVESNGGTLEMVNVTVSGNYGTGLRMYNGASGVLTHVTIADNTFGLVADEAAQITLWNTIIAANLGTADCLTQGASVGGAGSLLGESTCLNGFPDPSNIFETDPKLGPLAPNGASLWTHALKPGSPAIDAALPERCVTPDQRGVARPKDGNGDGVAQCDIGAYEFVAPGERGRGGPDRGR